MLIDTIKKDLITATKAQDPLVLKTIRFILSEINYAKIDLQRELTDADVIKVLQKEVKKRQDAIEMMRKGKRMELVSEEEEKLKVITKYLPREMNLEELEKIITEVIQAMPGVQMGPIIGETVKRAKGRASGSTVAKLVAEKLRSN